MTELVCFEKRPIPVREHNYTQDEIDAVIRRATSEQHDRNEIILSIQFLVDTGKWHGNFVLPALE